MIYNPTKAREECLSSCLRKLRNDGITDETVFQKILPGGSSPGVLYGLAKVHKTGCPLRPIALSVNTYNYNLESYLIGRLQSISTNQHTVEDPFRFADWAKADIVPGKDKHKGMGNVKKKPKTGARARNSEEIENAIMTRSKNRRRRYRQRGRVFDIQKCRERRGSNFTGLGTSTLGL